ncbi:MAG: HemK2/MTQ2 family protein methyltransferase [Candidatus Nanohaloarchaea archaeon]|nr:HemK2/MTQ2 family protein methyltransferase [Candidatus Nanohaloarchaea archaeon]
MDDGIYRPRKDSYLLKEVLERQELAGKRVLDMGTGSGILAVAAAERGADVTAVDVDPAAVRHVQERATRDGLDIEVVESDLFEAVEGGYDLITFNPPYIPGGGRQGDALMGGQDGREVTDRFIATVADHLQPGGRVLLVQSSRNDVETTVDAFQEEGLDADVVEREKLHFEELVVVEAVRHL